MSNGGTEAGNGSFAPFRVSAFAVLWSATVLSNVGTWMMSTGSAWLMTTLSPSVLMVSAVQASGSAPIFLFALFAGALSDIFDRRKLLLACQSLAAISAAGFALLVWSDAVSAPVLLAFTFAMATAAAFVAPPWQAIVPQLVPKPMLGQAIALNSMGINVARAIGPALAGLLIVTVGIAGPFVANAFSFLFILAGLLWWRPATAEKSGLAREHVPGAIAGGLRFAANSIELKAAIARAAGFFLFASAPMSLLPILAREALRGDAASYGILMAAIGIGAVSGAFVLPRLKKLSPSVRLLVGSALASAGGAAMALSASLELAICACILFGLGWILVLATLNTAAQMSLPDWVRARGLALFTMVFSGAMMLGSLVWGAIALRIGVQDTLLTASAGGMVAALMLARLKLADGSIDLSPSAVWPDPVLTTAHDLEGGPVVVTIEYRVALANRQQIMSALNALAPARRRSGAIYWAAFEDGEEPGRILEMFTEPSLVAHLRHHERVSAFDQELHDAVHRLHTGEKPPKVTHWLPPKLG